MAGVGLEQPVKVVVSWLPVQSPSLWSVSVDSASTFLDGHAMSWGLGEQTLIKSS